MLVIRFYAHLAKFWGASRAEVPLDALGDATCDRPASDSPPRLRDLIAYLERRKPGFRALVLDGGAIRKFLHVVHNLREIPPDQALHAPLAEGDQVAFLPPIAGG